MRVPDLKVKLRQIGVEPDDFPECSERADLVALFKKKYDEKAQDNKDIKRQKELMKMSLPVCLVSSLSVSVSLCLTKALRKDRNSWPRSARPWPSSNSKTFKRSTRRS